MNELSMLNSKLILSDLVLIVLAMGMTFIQSTVELSTLKRHVFRSQIAQGTHV